ncbi:MULTISPECIES: hypothetical protein [unclassified Streptomyces]|uniref:hypothetical protein n=1 Tax=unclassified Streptomyces TaxID=2593676 RepID=UPI00225129B3|nr:hypothetical protein [Streptomyces sp. NBC_00047]MCX5610214.1 hypothetical protein [Streptomyces sp. NBC_00047]
MRIRLRPSRPASSPRLRLRSCSPYPRRARRPTCALLVAVALLGGSALIGCDSGSDSRDSGPRIPAAPGDPVPVKVVAATTTTVDLGGGAHLIVPPGAMTDGATIRATYRHRPDGAWNELTPTSAPVELTAEPADAIHGLLTLEFPVPAPPAGAGTETSRSYGVSTFEEKSGAWMPYASTYDAARRMIIAQIPHFSWWNPFSWNWVDIGARVNQNVGQALKRRAGQPACSGGAPDWVAALNGVTADAAVAVRGCAQAEDDVLDVQLVNNRPYGMVLEFGAPVKWRWHEGGGSAQEIGANALGDALAGPGRLYLPPLGRASVGIPRTPAAQVSRFRIGPTAGSLFVDFATQGADFLVGKKLPEVGNCTVMLASYSPDLSAASLRDTIVSAGDCLKDSYLREVAAGKLDRATVDQLSARLDGLKKASVVGRWWTIYGIEWQFADLFVDQVVVSDAGGLGAGFSLLARRPADPPRPTAPATTSAPPPGPSHTGDGPTPPPVSPNPPPPAPAGRTETVAGLTHTWTDYRNAGGREGPRIDPGASVLITCKVRGFAVANGNSWWYRIGSPPWSDLYYASADPFYNNGQTSGPVKGTPFVDEAVPNCA